MQVAPPEAKLGRVLATRKNRAEGDDGYLDVAVGVLPSDEDVVPAQVTVEGGRCDEPEPVEPIVNVAKGGMDPAGAVVPNQFRRDRR
jgi:hypothetical protein